MTPAQEARQAAKARGEMKYTSPIPCRHGHVPLRYTSNDRCVDCIQENTKRYRELHGDKRRPRNRKKQQKLG